MPEVVGHTLWHDGSAKDDTQLDRRGTGRDDVARLSSSYPWSGNASIRRRNAVDDPELIDCVRQSAFTVDLPTPSTTGVDDIELTIPFEGAPDAGAPSPR
jgi:hypothetical protein